jgi:hypothetical protein
VCEDVKKLAQFNFYDFLQSSIIKHNSEKNSCAGGLRACTRADCWDRHLNKLSVSLKRLQLAPGRCHQVLGHGALELILASRLLCWQLVLMNICLFAKQISESMKIAKQFTHVRLELMKRGQESPHLHLHLPWAFWRAQLAPSSVQGQ